MRWRVPVEISSEDLEALVKKSTVVLEREKHRLIHEGDWRRWGSRGGRETLRRYGPRWFALLARRRWGSKNPGPNRRPSHASNRAGGARIAGTVVRSLSEKKGKLGLATMCVGVGQGVSVAFERV